MPVSVATWNINSIRLREGLVMRLLEATAPDVLCLQETKSPVDKIPLEGFAGLGYPHMVARGQKGYNGVAILSRLPIEDAGRRDFCEMGDARHVAARLPNGVVVHNFYVPAGGDEPDPAINPKFDHKLRFLSEMRDWFADAAGHPGPAILVGDLNIAPLEDDVWSHKSLRKVVSHTPVEIKGLNAVMATRGWVDLLREERPAPERLYSWWSYRAKDWREADRGRRLDHIWATPDIAAKASGNRILKDARGWERPSDHAPVFASFDF